MYFCSSFWSIFVYTISSIWVGLRNSIALIVYICLMLTLWMIWLFQRLFTLHNCAITAIGGHVNDWVQFVYNMFNELYCYVVKRKGTNILICFIWPLVYCKHSNNTFFMKCRLNCCHLKETVCDYLQWTLICNICMMHWWSTFYVQTGELSDWFKLK